MVESGIPVIFRSGASPQIATYDWYDAGLGSGYKRFYCGATFLSGANAQYYLTTKQHEGDYSVSGANTVYQQVVRNNNTTINFDLTFNNPAVVKGEMLIRYCKGWNNGSQNFTIFNIYHVRNAVSTLIGTVTTNTDNNPASSVFRRLAKVTVSQKAFAKGDILRISMKMVEYGNQDARWDFLVGGRVTATENGTSATVDNEMYIDVPFRIDL
jgi:hypothetical protein